MRLFGSLNNLFLLVVKVVFLLQNKDKGFIRYYAIHNTLNFVKICISGYGD
jgi:uncharacterized membrane protein